MNARSVTSALASGRSGRPDHGKLELAAHHPDGSSAPPDAEVVHVVFNEALGPVFESMVVAPITSLRDHGCSARLVLFAPPGDFVVPRRREHWSRVRSLLDEKLDGCYARLPSPSRRLPNAASVWNINWHGLPPCSRVAWSIRSARWLHRATSPNKRCRFPLELREVTSR